MNIRSLVQCLLATAAICSCGSGSVNFYSLSPSPLSSSTASLRGPVVEFRHMHFPGYLNNPQIVTTSSTGEVTIDERNRWVEDLSANFQRTFLQDLASSLKTSDVYVSGFSGRPATVIVELDVVRFDQDSDGVAHLTSRWSVTRAPNATEGQSGVAVLSEPVTTSGYDARVAALSRLVDTLAGQIAQVVSEVSAK